MRDHQELRDAAIQSAANREILAALARDVANPGAVLDAIVEHSARFFRGARRQVFLLEGRCLPRRQGGRRTLPGLPPHCRSTRSPGTGPRRWGGVRWTWPPIRSPTWLGRRLRAADPAAVGRIRTMLATPICSLQGEVAGVLSMWRTEVAPFGMREREQLEEFAAQATIAVHMRLFRVGNQDNELEIAKPAQIQFLASMSHELLLNRDRLLRGAAGPHVRRHQRAPGGRIWATSGNAAGTYFNSSTRSWTCRRSKRVQMVLGRAPWTYARPWNTR